MDKDNFLTRVLRQVRQFIDDFFPGKSNTLIFAFLGFVAALLLLSIGFWRMLVISVFVFIGVAFGQQLDGNPKMINWLKGLFSDKQQ